MFQSVLLTSSPRLLLPFSPLMNLSPFLCLIIWTTCEMTKKEMTMEELFEERLEEKQLMESLEEWLEDDDWADDGEEL